MKKIFGIIAAYIFFCLGVCIAWAFCSGAPIPVLLERTVLPYKLCTGLELFCSLLPATLAASFCVSLAMAFGMGDGEKCRLRFSAEIFRLYKLIVVVCLICVAILTAATELGKPLLTNYKKHLERQEILARDYERNSGNMYRAGSFDLSYQYAKLALELDPDSETAKRLMSDAGIGKEAHKDVAAENKKKDAPSNKKLSEEGFTIIELRTLAEKAYRESKWFDAHYYAQTAVNIAEPRDTSLQLMQDIAAESWNRLETPANDPQSEEERLYAMKLSGYGALMRGDNLKAYYVFMSLSRRSKIMANDPDVVRYLAIAQERLERAYFFMDEMIGKRDFETASNVHFALKHEDGTTDIIHIKGIVPVAGKSGTVQYFRGFTMMTIDELGNMKRKLYDENVKMLSADAQDFEGIVNLPPNVMSVPYLLLHSVDRYNEAYESTAEYTITGMNAAESSPHTPETLVLPMSCEDFELVKEASKGADRMDIVALIKIILNADKYGYSSEVFAEIMLDRLLYPMLVLCAFMVLASFAWNFRIKQEIPFQTVWIFSFPILTAGAAIMVQVILWLYSIMNHVFVGVAGLMASPIFGLSVYIVIFIVASVVFLARNNIDPPVTERKL